MVSNDHKRRMERKVIAKANQTRVIDTHDLLHSIFWGKPTRDELKEVWARMNEELASRKINLMRAEIDEAIELGMGSKYSGGKP